MDVPATLTRSAWRREVDTDWPWLVLLGALVVLYLAGLGSPYAPTNGDEMVYVHIARATAESGHWLPLQSDIPHMRNTKPPLLFWQAIVAGGWGQSWNLFMLRLPSVVYTLLTAACTGFFAYRFQPRLRTACLATALFLLYFSSFRYSRVYLTSAPETFWLALPMWWLLWLRLRSPGDTNNTNLTNRTSAHLSWRAFSAFGLAMGLGAAYKSFALLAPCAAGLWCAWLLGEAHRPWRSVWRTTLGLGWSVLVGLAMFASWFVLDPDPGTVWQEFVVGENMGKMQSELGYWQAALHGTYPMWPQLLAYPVNAGLLALQTMGFLVWSAVYGVRVRVLRALTPAHWVLVAWLLVWLIVFTIPSQRSERYVIPAMPALAIAMALAWDRCGRLWSLGALVIAAPALLILGRIAWVIGDLQMGTPLWSDAAVAVAGGGVLVCVAGLFVARWTRVAGLLACLAIYATFGLAVTPLGSVRNDYPPQISALLDGQRVAVPNGFTGQFENFHFNFPAAHLVPYDVDGRNTGALYPDMPPAARLQRLLHEFDAVVWRQTQPLQTEPECVPRCRVLVQRWHVRGRQKEGEVTMDNLWYPQQWLFDREWLVVGVQQTANTRSH